MYCHMYRKTSNISNGLGGDNYRTGREIFWGFGANYTRGFTVIIDHDRECRKVWYHGCSLTYVNNILLNFYYTRWAVFGSFDFLPSLRTDISDVVEIVPDRNAMSTLGLLMLQNSHGGNFTEMILISNFHISLNITNSTLQPHIPGADE